MHSAAINQSGIAKPESIRPGLATALIMRSSFFFPWVLKFDARHWSLITTNTQADVGPIDAIVQGGRSGKKKHNIARRENLQRHAVGNRFNGRHYYPVSQ